MVGLCFQESILIKVASLKNTNYRLAIPEEESVGIDGYIGNKSVSIKPATYKTKNMYGEQIDVDIIFYDKKKMALTLSLIFKKTAFALNFYLRLYGANYRL